MLDGASAPKAIFHQVIVVGGGWAGIAMALALERANIDYILLEKGDFAPQLGASVVVAGCAMRLLDQLNLMQSVIDIGSPLEVARYSYENGALLVEGEVPKLIRDQTGYPMMILSRQELLQVLYDGIQDKSKCLSHTRVASFHEDDEGVEVKCENGQVYKGSILVGADGIHSRVRDYMFENLEKTHLKESISKTRSGLSSQFSCVFGLGGSIEALGSGKVYIVCGNGRSVMLTMGKDSRIFLFFYESIPTAYHGSMPKYSQEDAKKSLEQMYHIPVHNGITMKDVVDKLTIYFKVPLEEHTYEHVYSTRVCLVGDSLHKMTPNDGFGGTMAMEGAVDLVNAIARHLPKTEEPNKTIPKELVEKIFKEYADRTLPRVKEVVKSSGISTRLQAGQNFAYRAARYAVLPYVPLGFIASMFVNLHKKGVVLDSLPRPQHKGTVKYTDEEKLSTGST